MSTKIGVVVDVSGSMKENAVGKLGKERGEWARSVITVIDDLIKNDVSSGNVVFTVAVGGSRGREVLDVLRTLELYKVMTPEIYRNMSYNDILEQSYSILEKNGAYLIRRWAPGNVIKSTVSRETASWVLSKLESDKHFRILFVYFWLPEVCRDSPNFPVFKNIFGFVVTSVGKRASPSDIKDVIQRAIRYFQKNMDNVDALVAVNNGSIFDVHKASEIIHGCVDGGELSTERVTQLLDSIEPYIYGATPLFQGLNASTRLFSQQGSGQYKNLLFVLSDGKPTDKGKLDEIITSLKDENVKVVCCYITRLQNIQPKKLYCCSRKEWEDGAKFLFELSSTVPTQLLPRAIFVKQGWEIEIINNETKLFMHVNHPDVLHDVCDLARKVVCSQDALSDILVSVSLDMYINQYMTGFPAQRQIGGTCYANASAAVVHLAMQRILGREGGYPEFNTLRDDLISRHGTQGAVTINVLHDICPQYRLRCKMVDEKGALEAVAAKRPVVVCFALTEDDWGIFSRFYANSPTGILTKKEFNILWQRRRDLQGHAVVLTSFNSDCLHLMNSWGNDWADMGFFRVENASVLDMKFIDVYWTIDDLTKSEMVFYEQHGAEVANKLISKLIGLQQATYKCPLCSRTSLVSQFTGQLLRAKCPKCRRTFKCEDTGNILALNMYLLSLSR